MQHSSSVPASQIHSPRLRFPGNSSPGRLPGPPSSSIHPPKPWRSTGPSVRLSHSLARSLANCPHLYLCGQPMIRTQVNKASHPSGRRTRLRRCFYLARSDRAAMARHDRSAGELSVQARSLTYYSARPAGRASRRPSSAEARIPLVMHARSR